MRLPILTTFLALLTTSLTTAFTPTSQTSINVQILRTPKFFDLASLPASTTATLTTLGKIHTVPISTHNSFAFRNVTKGSYLLDVHCKTADFTPLRVDVFPITAGEGAAGGLLKVEAWRTFRGNEWDDKGEKMGVSGEVHPHTADGWVTVEGLYWLGGKQYYVQRAGFSPLSLLKNPMILIAGFSMLVVFGMPYLMDNMDPQMRAEFEEAQRAGPMAGLLGGGGGGKGAQNFDLAARLADKSMGKEAGPITR